MQQRSYITVTHPGEPIEEKPAPPITFVEVIHNEYPGSVAKMPPIDFPDEPGLEISVGWSSSLSNDFVGNGTTGIIRVRWGKNDGSLHGKKDYRRLMRSQANRPIYAQAGVDSDGNVIVIVDENDTGGTNPRIHETIAVPEGAEWAQLAELYTDNMEAPDAPPPPVLPPTYEAPIVQSSNAHWDSDPGVTKLSSAMNFFSVRPGDTIRLRWGHGLVTEGHVDFDAPPLPPFDRVVSPYSSFDTSVLPEYIDYSGPTDGNWWYNHYASFGTRNAGGVWYFELNWEVQVEDNYPEPNRVYWDGEWDPDTETWRVGNEMQFYSKRIPVPSGYAVFDSTAWTSLTCIYQR